MSLIATLQMVLSILLILAIISIATLRLYPPFYRRHTQWRKRQEKRYIIWASSLVEDPANFIVVMIGEIYFLIIILAIASSIGLKAVDDYLDWIFFFFALAVLKQLNDGWTNLDNPLHISDMAKNAIKKNTKWPSNFRDNMRWSRRCLNGVARVGRSMSGTHFEDIVIARLNELQPNEEHDVRLRQILKAIEDQMAQDFAFSGTPASGKCPSILFCKSIQEMMNRNVFTVGDLADLLLKHYSQLKDHVKKNLARKAKPPSATTIQLRALRWQIIGSAIGVAAPSILQWLLPGVFEWLFPG